MSKKKPPLKLAKPKNKDVIWLESRTRFLEKIIYKMANDITLSDLELVTLAQILEKGDVYGRNYKETNI